MQRIIKILKSTVVFSVLVVSMSSCIYDHYNTVQFNIHVHAVDNSGNQLSDNTLQGQHLYFFVNERYSAELYPDANGNYFSSFPEGTVVQFVSVASEDSTAFRFNPPVTGDHIHNWYAEVLDYNNIPPLYYGSTILGESSDDVSIVMKDIRCRFRVLVRNLKNRLGDGDYNVVIGGLRRAITYEGEGCGDIVEKQGLGSMQSSGDWLSNEIISLPTAIGEGITIRLYRDSEVAAFANLDDEGEIMSLYAGDDKVFIITLYDHARISVHVAPWSEINQDFTLEPL